MVNYGKICSCRDWSQNVPKSQTCCPVNQLLGHVTFVYELWFSFEVCSVNPNKPKVHKPSSVVQTRGTDRLIAYLLTSSAGEHDSSQTELVGGERQRSAAVGHP